MIPANITQEHIIKAINEIAKNGVPPGRDSKKFKLLFQGSHYPPKYVISIANRFANGIYLDPQTFNGGVETNSFLNCLGFEITQKNFTDVPKKLQKESLYPPYNNSQSKTHDERCPECKRTIELLLNTIFGKVLPNHQFDVNPHPETYRNSDIYPSLNKIFERLKDYQGHSNFIKTEILPKVDFYIPNPGFVVEFDESQHFTQPRNITLVNYPDYLNTGFSRARWIQLCNELNKRDNDPLYRDEQRAWYDTLRDFLPLISGLKPTVRLYADEMKWCSLDPNNRHDVKRFQNIIEGKKENREIQIRSDNNPLLARIILVGDWLGGINPAREILNKICEKWPEGKHVHCLVTCGAFLSFDWPAAVEYIHDNRFPEDSIIDTLYQTAENRCRELLDENIRKKLLKHTDYITIGIDSYKEKISTTTESIRKPHAELVALVDLRNNTFYWTGKSYPTTGQEHGLVRIKDATTHFFNLPFGETMILGCHDLNIFSPRGRAVTKSEWRIDIRKQFDDLVGQKKPRIVLHHPHTTDSDRIWIAPINDLLNHIPSVELFISAGRYYREEGVRSKINDVLISTKRGSTLDFIVAT